MKLDKGLINELTFEELSELVDLSNELEEIYKRNGNIVFRQRVFNMISALHEENRKEFLNTITYQNFHTDKEYIPTKSDFGILATFERLSIQTKDYLES